MFSHVHFAFVYTFWCVCKYVIELQLISPAVCKGRFDVAIYFRRVMSVSVVRQVVCVATLCHLLSSIEVVAVMDLCEHEGERGKVWYGCGVVGCVICALGKVA